MTNVELTPAPTPEPNPEPGQSAAPPDAFALLEAARARIAQALEARTRALAARCLDADGLTTLIREIGALTFSLARLAKLLEPWRGENAHPAAENAKPSPPPPSPFPLRRAGEGRARGDIGAHASDRERDVDFGARGAAKAERGDEGPPRLSDRATEGGVAAGLVTPPRPRPDLLRPPFRR